MRRARKHKWKVITITLVSIGAISAASIIIVGNQYLSNNQVPKEQLQAIEESNNNTVATISPPESTGPIEIISVNENALNQNNQKVNASKQSSLEKAVEDLIILTEQE